MPTHLPPFTPAFGAQNIAQDNILQSANHSRIGVNGFGQIGRNLLRASLLRDNVSVVGINHTYSSVEDVIRLLMHGSIHGALDKLMGHKTQIDILPNGSIAIDGQHIALMSERNLEKINFTKPEGNYVAECTGKFRPAAANMSP
ncbi:hypothetical protein BELL_0135g00210 [Botrytis elliptica]|uniref:Glyceraldehyde 3-phosphate dehydrogenase NAD(P) binding domain-containing protein n=1 Tax=Botrytis elliptica TaxID=278938 RepID=A0A4Z1JT82_9HELO|nr:hypothetical protein BELL_0135g00210 [Botrytis elliptica]